jgi:type II secretory pathway pseudopilin PulG
LRAKQAAKVGDPALFGRKVVWWLYDGGATTCNPCTGANGLDARAAATSGVFSVVDPTATRYSMLRQTTGAAANDASSFHGGYTAYRAGNQLYFDTYGTPLSGGAAAVRGWVGMTSATWSEITAADNPSSFPTAAFRFSTSAEDTNWMIYTSDGTTSAATATTVAADVNPHRFTIEFDLSNSQIKFYIDGVLAGTSATALPAGSQLLRWLMAATTLEGVDKSADAGWVYIEADR